MSRPLGPRSRTSGSRTAEALLFSCRSNSICLRTRKPCGLATKTGFVWRAVGVPADQAVQTARTLTAQNLPGVIEHLHAVALDGGHPRSGQDVVELGEEDVVPGDFESLYRVRLPPPTTTPASPGAPSTP
jgi:hypothetical protein